MERSRPDEIEEPELEPEFEPRIRIRPTEDPDDFEATPNDEFHVWEDERS